MITTAEQYNANLHLIHNINPPTYATLPTADNIYNIDVNTREIDAPQFLAVEKDNISETIYFIVDRYADYMDLATTSCIITYTNAAGKSRIYTVPFYDIYSYASEKKIILPWCLDIGVAEAPGEVEFAIQFFKVGEILNPETNGMEKVVQYSLNTLPAKSKVLVGMTVENFDINSSDSVPAYAAQYLLEKINYMEQLHNDNYGTYWTVLD